jgi:hypothetical protein
MELDQEQKVRGAFAGQGYFSELPRMPMIASDAALVFSFLFPNPCHRCKVRHLIGCLVFFLPGLEHKRSGLCFPEPSS